MSFLYPWSKSTIYESKCWSENPSLQINCGGPWSKPNHPLGLGFLPHTDSILFIHIPSSSLIFEMLFLLLLLRVDSWKNFVFLSPALIQSSLDFWFYLISFLICHPSSSKFKATSISKFSLEGLTFWIFASLFSRSLILS